MVLESTKIIRKLAGPMPIIFNDRLVDGTRSYKIWGWNLSDYNRALQALKSAGFTTKLVFFEGYSKRGRRQYIQPRIHVA
jgi:hypothetical protein